MTYWSDQRILMLPPKGMVWRCLAIWFTLMLWPLRGWSADSAAAHFRGNIQPILLKYCSDCHADGANKGGVSFDEFKSDEEIITNHDLWLKVMKNVRAGLMPPQKKKERPSPEEQKQLVDWIKFESFGIDPQNPDPGRVTVRRLNRVEYHNTIRDLMGVDFSTETEFPPDDTGYGFDNIGDVLNLSPMLLEKYLAAAKAIVEQSVPTMGRMPAEQLIPGERFRDADDDRVGKMKNGAQSFSFYKPAAVSAPMPTEHAGNYRIMLELVVKGKDGADNFDSNRCEVVFKLDDHELLRQKFGWHEKKELSFPFDEPLAATIHKLSFEVQPVAPATPKTAALEMRLVSVMVRGPMEEQYWVRPKNYDRFFTKDAPKRAPERRTYAAELLRNFATKAFRRPVDDRTVEKLAALAEGIYNRRGQTFEAGIAHAMTAVLASPRFIFREEGAAADPAGKGEALIDEYALASRLSYFLWSSMPDDELMRLAGSGELRANQTTQVKRMLADSRAEALTRNFTGQWLQARDIETVDIDAFSVLEREDGPFSQEEKKKRRKEKPRVELNYDLRDAMRRETERYFGHIVHEDRDVVELVRSDYTFLNAPLAKHYGLTNLDVRGNEMRLVKLPPDSPRGGVLTQGTVLGVTSNPTRTSPVKRGLFILDNILGLPPPPPPPNIPPLEAAAKEANGRKPTLRETLELHRSQPLCSSCHSRMDPLGLALENFNAMGMWRDQEYKQPIDVTGKLLTGESFTNIRELKDILADKHRVDFYRTLTEKLFTYALGRGLEYYDAQSVDTIVDRLDKSDGHFSALMMGIIESSPFQKRRNTAILGQPAPSKGLPQRAELK